MPRRLLAGLAGIGAASVLVLVWAIPAWAHVTVNPDTAVKGSYAELSFRVPNEQDATNTVGLDVKFPTDHPIANVSVKPKPGWAYRVKTSHLAQPVKTDDGEVDEVVSEIIWTGGAIAPGQYDDFDVSAGPLPSDTAQIAFPAIQTYSNGEKVSWIEPSVRGAPEPEHPAPVLHLVAPAEATDTTGSSGATDGGRGADAPHIVTDAATRQQLDSADTKALVGIVLGAVGVAVGLGGLAFGLRKRRG